MFSLAEINRNTIIVGQRKIWRIIGEGKWRCISLRIQRHTMSLKHGMSDLQTETTYAGPTIFIATEALPSVQNRL